MIIQRFFRWPAAPTALMAARGSRRTPKHTAYKKSRYKTRHGRGGGGGGDAPAAGDPPGVPAEAMPRGRGPQAV